MAQEHVPENKVEDTIKHKRHRERPKKIIVELGAGHHTLPGVGTRKFSKREAFVATDPNAKWLMWAKEEYERNRRDKEKYKKAVPGPVHFRVAPHDLTRFKESTVDEVYIGDVFGSPPNYQPESWSVDALDEAVRILKPGGKLVIKETNTPAFKVWVVEAIERAGLVVDRVARPKDKDWKKINNTYQKHHSTWTPGDDEAYFVFAHRPGKPTQRVGK